MISRAAVAVALVAVAGAAGPLIRAQQSSQGPPPQFRASVEYVEVDARVLDAQGQPARDLTQKDFTVFEDGVRQTLSNFSVVDIPVVSATGSVVAATGVKPDVSSNMQGRASRRTYLIVIDDGSIEPARTVIVRAFLRRFIERSLGPDDVVGIATTGRSAAYENFTNDKPRLIAAVNRMAGYSEGSASMNAFIKDLGMRASLVAGGRNAQDTPVQSALTVEPRNSQLEMAQIVHAMSAAGPGAKAIIYVSEGIPFEMITNTEGLSLVGDVERLSTQARRTNVPIYPVDPRGLSSGFERAIELPIVAASADPVSGALNEVRRAQQGMRNLADDSGGFPIVGKNDIDAGIDRIVDLTSSYYVLGYYSTYSRHDGKYHKINVTVDRPGVRVLNRRGYTSALVSARPGPRLAGPQGSSIELREALNSVLPVSGLPLAATVAAFRGMNSRASVSVVLEALGSDLVWKNDALAAPVEMTAIAIEKSGAIKASDVHRLLLSTRTVTSERVRQFGFRWLARLDDMKPGRYQIRAAVANGPGKQGSVWYDIEIPDFSKNPLTMSDVMLTAVAAMLRPTLQPDKLLVDALPGPPATLRDFPDGANVAVYAEVYDNQLDRPHDVETTVIVANERGEIAFRTVQTYSSKQLMESRGVLHLKAGIPLVNIPPGNYTLTVDARQTVNRTVSAARAVPFRVVR